MTRRRAPGVLVAAIAAVLGLATGCGDDGGSPLGGDGYGEATERAFMRACVQDGGTDVREVCACSYREITRTIDFDEYRSIDRRVRDDPDDLPGELLDIVADCGASEGGGDENGEDGDRREEDADDG